MLLHVAFMLFETASHFSQLDDDDDDGDDITCAKSQNSFVFRI